MRYGTGGSFGGGPRYGWGAVPGPGTTGSRTNWNRPHVGGSGVEPEAGLRRGAWQWRGHGPNSWRGYGWEYQGGFARDRPIGRSEAATGRRNSMPWRLAARRAGGSPTDQGRWGDTGWWEQGGRRGERYGFDYRAAPRRGGGRPR